MSVHCTKSCICSQKVLLRMGEFVARNMHGWIKKINKRKSCCILLVIYIVSSNCWIFSKFVFFLFILLELGIRSLYWHNNMYKRIVFICPDDEEFRGSDLTALCRNFHWNPIGGQSVSWAIVPEIYGQIVSHLASLSVRQFIFDIWTFVCVCVCIRNVASLQLPDNKHRSGTLY